MDLLACECKWLQISSGRDVQKMSIKSGLDPMSEVRFASRNSTCAKAVEF
jgi:hypothetical protein